MKNILITLIMINLGLVPLVSKAQITGSFPMNQVRYDTTLMDSVLYGHCEAAYLETSSLFSDFYGYYYNDYNFTADALLPYKEQLSNTHITIVLGSWCSDSQEQVPRFLRILDELEYDHSKLTLICVGRDKAAEGTGVEALNIELVPTFIVYQNGEEKGRIIETPTESLEADLLNILKQED